MSPNARHKKTTHREKVLSIRIADWTRTVDSTHPGQSGVTKRIEGGGFHKPGSNKK